MSKSVMLRTSNEDIKLNIDNYPVVANVNGFLANAPDGWCYVYTTDQELHRDFNCGYGLCYTNHNGTAFQIYICDDRGQTYVRRCESGYINLDEATWTLQT